MRIPFDLIAALIGLEAVRQALATAGPPGASRDTLISSAMQATPFPEAWLAMAGYWLVVWLYHEALARRVLWRVRWGRQPHGRATQQTASRRHPIEIQEAGEAFGQVLSVALYVLVLWRFHWPFLTWRWPEALGLDRVLEPRTLDAIAGSSLAGTVVDLGPFVVAMVLSWLPRRHVAMGLTGRRIPMRGWLGLEARMTFLPLVGWLVLNLFFDLANALGLPNPALYYAAAGDASGLTGGTVELAVSFLLMVLFAVFFLPLIMLKAFRCTPLPDGALKDRMQEIIRRSGVPVRAILSWGPRGSGLANACVMGPWARLRYVLISPGLTDLLTEEEAEAVVAHELGHARHGHLLLLLAVVLCLAALCEILAQVLRVRHPLLQAAVFVSLIICYLRFLFGFIMRACEREADLASAELTGSPIPLAHALEKLARVSGGIRDVYSWHHGSIARRVEVLMQDGLEPERMAGYHQRMRLLRLACFLFTALAIGLALLLTAFKTKAV